MRNDGNSFSVSTRVHSHNANKDDLRRLVFRLFEFLLGEEWFVWRMNDVINIMLMFGFENDEGELDKFSCQRYITPNIRKKIKGNADVVRQLIDIVYGDCLDEEEFTKIIDKINKATLTIYCKDLSEDINVVNDVLSNIIYKPGIEDVSSDAGINGDGEEIL